MSPDESYHARILREEREAKEAVASLATAQVQITALRSELIAAGLRVLDLEAQLAAATSPKRKHKEAASPAGGDE